MKQILLKTKDGSVDAELTQLYTDYYPKVVGYVRSKLESSCNDVEDLVADIFHKVIAGYHSFDKTRASVSTWIYRIAHNAVVDYYRSNSTNRLLSLELVPEATYLKKEVLEDDYADNLQMLTKGLQSLSERERDILILHYYKEMKLLEIASMMNLSYANIRVIESRAIQKLKKYIDAL